MIEGVQKVFGTLDLFVSLLETEIKYPILQGGILPFWTPSILMLRLFTLRISSQNAAESSEALHIIFSNHPCSQVLDR